MKNQGSKRLKNSRYISGFDGIRTLAVIGVIVYHLLPYNLQGGYLGVPIFFVVSGYLITDLLLQEYEQNGRINVVSFYERRMKRLYPALVAMLLATAAYITLFQRNFLANLKTIIWTNMLYVYNWWEIGNGSSYFDRFNGESPFTHLWSLSIEGQYYLVWPVVLIGLLMLFKQRKQIFYLMMAVAAASAVWMGVLFQNVNDTNRVYYGTDTRMFAILLGAGLALFWPSVHLKKNISQRSRMVLNTIGGISLLGMLIMFFTLSGQSTFTYRGGMFLMTLLSAVFVATVAHPGADMNRLMSNPIFDWVGKRSYGIYLYQFPVMIFFEQRMTNYADHAILYPLIEVAIILIISDLSYRYLENPLRRYHYSQLWPSLKAFFTTKPAFAWKQLWLIPAVFVTVIALYGAAISPSHAQQTALQKNIDQNEKSLSAGNKAALKKQQAELKKQKAAKASKRKLHKVHLSKHEKGMLKDYNLTKKDVVVAKNMNITAIGDSVMADNSHDLKQIFPNAYISASVGRQIWQAPDVISDLKAKKALSDTVIINLGTNSPMTKEEIDKVIHMIGPKREIFWINCHVPTRNWEDQVNATIAKAATRYKNMKVIDWHGASANHADWFYDDHVHPNPTGNTYFSGLVAREVVSHTKQSDY